MKAYTEQYLYYVALSFDDGMQLDLYKEWCSNTFGNEFRKWYIDDGNFTTSTKIRFTDEADRNWFMLRWAG